MRMWYADREVVLGPPKQRAVLGLLASRPNQVAGIDQIIDAVWGTDVPPTAVNGVHTYVGGLRRALEPNRGPRESGGLLVSAGGGYALRLDPQAVDVDRFTTEHTRARRLLAAGDRDGAIAAYESALALWHGDAYANVPGPFAALEQARLHELRLTAVEEWAEATLETGRHAETTTVLTDLVAKEPLRERLRWLLMLALHRAGRRAHALTVYRQTRQLLQEELGIDPGAELRRLHQQILGDHADLDLPAPGPRPLAPTVRPIAPPLVKPAQLPPGTRDFTGRTEELARLRNVVLREHGRSEQHAVTAVVEGPPGVGKTAVALRLARRLADHYPEGQLYVDLRGSRPGEEPVDAHGALALLLRSLGVEQDQLPRGLPGRTTLFRSLLHGRKVLIVVDDALNAEQVRPLVPRGPACVLVTSRRRQFGLAARDGAYRLELAPLAPTESVELLTRLLGEDRVADQQAAAYSLARICGNLPLALRIAAVGLVAKPAVTLAELVDDAADDTARLDRLAIEDDVAASLRSAFAASVRSLTAEVARTFSALGQHGNELITVELTAALTGTGRESAARRLAALADHHLLEEVGRDRYRFHNLIGLYAAECARGQRTDRATARDRLDREPVPADDGLPELVACSTERDG
ncbi:BTAD domain-containing putative transcriptional regulator [Kitasatospora sp. NPDC098652]|uniref:AfsR/SARP family transcriptional regulator n=1 Tax=Kitasatospora sp. NPDC098652 TaxID=3364095 RepID=UPI00381EDDBC